VPVLPIKLTDGVWRIPTFGRNLINSYLIENSDGTISLIDCGLKSTSKKLIASLRAINRSPEEVREILITHAHSDHLGGARKFQEASSGKTHIHESDVSYAENGKNPPIGGGGPLGRVLGFVSSSIPSCHIDQTFKDGDRFNIGTGLTVLHTPGHSPGHCSFYLGNAGLLITGDALFNFRDKISYSFAAFCYDEKMSKDTAERLGDPDYEIVAFTHGPPIRENAKQSVREFLGRR
jgi:glyoxylase-like metal-dependent hydrolase (beta-lactamase superfamily II)